MPGITMRPPKSKWVVFGPGSASISIYVADGHDALTAYREGLYKRCEPSLVNTRAFTGTGSAGGG